MKTGRQCVHPSVLSQRPNLTYEMRWDEMRWTRGTSWNITLLPEPTTRWQIESSDNQAWKSIGSPPTGCEWTHYVMIIRWSDKPAAPPPTGRTFVCSSTLFQSWNTVNSGTVRGFTVMLAIHSMTFRNDISRQKTCFLSCVVHTAQLSDMNTINRRALASKQTQSWKLVKTTVGWRKNVWFSWTVEKEDKYCGLTLTLGLTSYRNVNYHPVI